MLRARLQRPGRCHHSGRIRRSSRSRRRHHPWQCRHRIRIQCPRAGARRHGHPRECHRHRCRRQNHGGLHHHHRHRNEQLPNPRPDLHQRAGLFPGRHRPNRRPECAEPRHVAEQHHLLLHQRRTIHLFRHQFLRDRSRCPGLWLWSQFQFRKYPRHRLLLRCRRHQLHGHRCWCHRQRSPRHRLWCRRSGPWLQHRSHRFRHQRPLRWHRHHLLRR